LAPAAKHSLFRNGKVLTRRDRDGSDDGRLGVDLEPREVPIQDARRLDASAQCTLTRNGFELRDDPLAAKVVDFFNHGQVLRDYYPRCAEQVRQASGADLVVAFDHNVRSAAGKQSKQRLKGGQQVQGPARVVHGDYTLTSGPQRLRDLTTPPGLNDTLRTFLSEGESPLEADRVARALESGRFAIINLWRNIADEPVENHPLGLCDAASVRPEDLVVFEIHYHDRVGENYFAKYHEGHQWYFYPALTRDEALLIKQWDSAGELTRAGGAKPDAARPDAPCTFSFHSSFEDPTTREDAPDRWSIEVRCMALWDHDTTSV
jgi:hypothetical protein